jgi:acetoacetyl-CoA synthetase
VRQAIRKNASPRHVPAKILAVPDIPKTRSGKIAEIAVRDTINGKEVGNTSALQNPQALDHFRDRSELATS